MESRTCARSTPTHIVNTTLNYYLEPEHGGSTFFYPGTAGNYRRKFNEQAVQVTDVRGSETDFRLDKQGFEVRRHVSAEKDFADEDVVKDVVYKETAELLKKAYVKLPSFPPFPIIVPLLDVAGLLVWNPE
jgi:hypothetical protein